MRELILIITLFSYSLPYLNLLLQLSKLLSLNLLLFVVIPIIAIILVIILPIILIRRHKKKIPKEVITLEDQPTQIPNDFRYCFQCGQKIGKEVQYCSFCGAKQ